MATSAVFTKTAGEIITQALRDSRIIPVEQSVQAIDFARGIEALNNIATEWQSQDINLWLTDHAVLPLVTDQRKYLLGPGGDECANEDNFFSTTLGANQVASDTAITVVSTTDMVAAPNILVTDPTASTQDWTAINSATLSISGGLVITNVGATAGGADFSLTTTIGQTYRVRFGYTLGTSSSCTFSVLNGVTVADTITLSATAANTELTITAATATITFRAQNVSTTTGETSTVSSLNFVDDETGSRIGFELTDGSRFWDRVLNVNTSATIDITAGLPSAASNGLSVFFYTTQIDRPLRLLRNGGQYSDTITGSETPANRWSRDEYFNQPDKDASGTVTQWYYQPTLENGELFVWQVASSVNNILRFSYIRPALVYTEKTDLLDFPSEFFMPLKWAIAAEIGPSYGVKDNRQLVLESKAVGKLEQALAHDTEMDAFYIQPDFN